MLGMSLGQTNQGSADARRDLKQQLPLIGGFVLLLLVSAGAMMLVITNQHFAEGVAHTLEVRSTAYRLLVQAQDAETGQRGFLLTGNRVYLDPYEQGRLAAPKALADLRRLVDGNAVQLAEVARLEVALNAKLAELAKTV
ncbi:CHASE3 domain-containing protein, partial [Halorubrum ezzemoulense]